MVIIVLPGPWLVNVNITVVWVLPTVGWICISSGTETTDSSSLVSFSVPETLHINVDNNLDLSRNRGVSMHQYDVRL